MISALQHFYGRDDVPIGAYKGADLQPNPGTQDDPNPLPYVHDMLHNFPAPIRTTAEVPTAVATYRRTLAAAADRSVVISSIGLSTNLAALLRRAAGARAWGWAAGW